MSKLRKWFFALGLAVLGMPAFADPDLSYQVPVSVDNTVTKLENAATAYADKILPYIAAVGLAFIGIAVVYLLFKVFKRFVSGK